MKCILHHPFFIGYLLLVTLRKRRSPWIKKTFSLNRQWIFTAWLETLCSRKIQWQQSIKVCTSFCRSTQCYQSFCQCHLYCSKHFFHKLNCWYMVVSGKLKIQTFFGNYARWNHHKSFEPRAPLTFWVPDIFQVRNQNLIMKYEPSDQFFINEN